MSWQARTEGAVSDPYEYVMIWFGPHIRDFARVVGAVRGRAESWPSFLLSMPLPGIEPLPQLGKIVAPKSRIDLQASPQVRRGTRRHPGQFR